MEASAERNAFRSAPVGVAIGLFVLGASGCRPEAEPVAATDAVAAAAPTLAGGSPARQAQAAHQAELGKREQQLMLQAQAHATGQIPMKAR